MPIDPPALTKARRIIAAVGEQEGASLKGPGHQGAADPSAVVRGFLFSDLREYTSFVEAHGDRAAADLLADYRAIVRDALAATGGGEVRTEGDSFYIVFSSVGAAVRCGLAIVDEAARASADRPDRPIRVGVGVHAGESVEQREGYVGSAVNIAARICAVAAPGEVLVSDTVRSLVRTSLPLTFRSRGRPRLKGIAEPVELFSVAPAAASGPVSAPRRAGSSRRLVAAGLGGFVVVALGGALGASVLLRPSAAGSPSSSPGPPVPAAIDVSALPGRIVYRSTQIGADGTLMRQAYVARPDGSTHHQVTPLTQNVEDFTTRQDGGAIAYLTTGAGLAIASLDDSTSTVRWPGTWGLPDFYDGAPLQATELFGWLPSGELLIERGQGTAAVPRTKAKLAANGQTLVPFAPGACTSGTGDVASGDDLAVSADGSLVAFRGGTDLWVLPLSGCPILLTEGVDASQPAWSADGSRVAFRGTAAGGATDIWVVKANGTGLGQLTTDAIEDAGATWSPDGAYVAWSRGVAEASRLWVMRADGTGAVQLPIGDPGERLDSPVWVPEPGPAAGLSPTPSVPNPFAIDASYGASVLDLDRPIALAIGSDGNIYITDMHPSVTVVDAFGARIDRWGSFGTGPGQFDFSAGDNNHGSIAVAPDGRVYVSDSHNARVQVFSPTGDFVRQFGTRGSDPGEFIDPFDLSVDAAGNVYVLDDWIRNLQKFGPTGAFLWRIDRTTLPDMTGHGHNADIDAEGRIVIGNDDTGRVLYLDSEGREVDAFDGRACGVTVDRDGNTYVAGCGSDTIEVFDPSHRLIGRWSGPTMPLDQPPEFGPNGVIFALGADGSLIRLSVTLAGR